MAERSAARHQPLRFDSRLPDLCRHIASQVPAQAIILTGSRATGHGLAPDSDYDLVAVMGTIQVPFYLNKLKRLEADLSRELGVEVSLNPLPKFRLRRASGNLYLFKLKHEGVTLWGQDFISRMEPGDAHDIRPQWLFSYLFTGMKHLGQDLQPGLTNPPLTRGAAKAILCCAEVLCLKQGFYPPTLEAALAWLREPGHLPLEHSFLADLERAIALRQGAEARPEDAGLWLQTRGSLVATFRHLMGHPLRDIHPGIKDLAKEYLKGIAWLKNSQYFALSLVLKRRFWWRTLADRVSIEKRVQVALLFSLLSITASGAVEGEPWAETCRLLAGRAQLPRNASWEEGKEAIYAALPLACPLMGI